MSMGMLYPIDCMQADLVGCLHHIRLYTYRRGLRRCISVVHSKMIFLICYLLDYQQVHDNVNVSIILLGDKKEPIK